MWMGPHTDPNVPLESRATRFFNNNWAKHLAVSDGSCPWYHICTWKLLNTCSRPTWVANTRWREVNHLTIGSSMHNVIRVILFSTIAKAIQRNKRQPGGVVLVAKCAKLSRTSAIKLSSSTITPSFRIGFFSIMWKISWALCLTWLLLIARGNKLLRIWKRSRKSSILGDRRSSRRMQIFKMTVQSKRTRCVKRSCDNRSK